MHGQFTVRELLAYNIIYFVNININLAAQCKKGHFGISVKTWQSGRADKKKNIKTKTLLVTIFPQKWPSLHNLTKLNNVIIISITLGSKIKLIKLEKALLIDC